MRIIIILCFCFAFFGGKFVVANSNYPFPQCLGPVCLQNIWADAEPFFKKYGKGFADEGKFPSYWYTTKQGIHINIERYHGENRPINHITISAYPLVQRAVPNPKIPFPTLATELGIQLGASLDSVLHLYGKPFFFLNNMENTRYYFPESWDFLEKDSVIVLDYRETNEPLCKEFFIVFENKKAILISLATPAG